MHIFLATPCYGGQVHHLYMASVVRLLQTCHIRRTAISLELLGNDSLITRSRNTLAAKFLNTPGATHLLFVDADIAFDPAQVFRMIEFDQDVIAGVYPLKMIQWDEAARQRAAAGEDARTAGFSYVGYPAEGEGYEAKDGFVTARYAGAGFLLVRRGVFDKMQDAFPQLRYSAVHTQPGMEASANQYAFFDAAIDPETGHYLSEDYAFCMRWRSLGGRIWLDTLGRLTHIGTHEFTGDPQRRFER